MLAGFPCQAFSYAGKRKGFGDTRGTLFFDVERLLKKYRPKGFLLENVRGLTTHDKGQFLKDSVDSVLNQTFQDFEIIIIDNGIKDIDETYENSRIHCFRSGNISLNAARNLGIENSKGKYIALLESGNLWKPEKLEKQVDILNKKPDIGLVYCGTSLIGKNKKYAGQNPLVTHRGSVFKKLVISNFLYNGSVPLFRKDCLEKTGWFDESVSYMTDWEFYLRFSINYKFWGIGDYLVIQLFYEKSGAHEVNSFEKSGFKILNRVFQRTDIENKHLRLINSAYAMRYSYVGKKFFEKSLFEKSRGYFYEAIKRDLHTSIKNDVLFFYLLSHLSLKNIEFLKNAGKKL